MAHEPRRLVTNTTPLITPSIACGHLDILQHLYDEVIVPKRWLQRSPPAAYSALV
jgi:predicted nucleic acid-binding protein